MRAVKAIDLAHVVGVSTAIAVLSAGNAAPVSPAAASSALSSNGIQQQEEAA